MKRAIFIIAAVIFISCNSTDSEHKNTPPDTLYTPALYVNLSGDVAGTFVYRITKDTSYFDTVNKSTAKLVYKRDTAYYIPKLFNLVDSSNKPIFDSTGKQKTVLQWVHDSTKFILADFNKKF